MGRILICFSNIDWNFVYQRHQHLMNGLAKEDFFERIIFVETLGIRNLKISDSKRVISKIKDIKERTRNKTSSNGIHPKINIISPVFIPHHNSISYKINYFLLKRMLRKQIAQKDEIYIWGFLPHPVVERFINNINPKFFIFDCIDDLKSFENVHTNVLKTEKRMIEKADLVSSTSLSLKEFTSQFNPNTLLLRNAVNFNHFSNNIDNELVDKIKRKYTRKVIGYFGVVYEWFDLNLIKKMAVEYKDCDIVIIGPVKIKIDEMKSYSNVYFEGLIDYSLLPSYLKAFDVGIIPFILNDLIRNTNPVKLYEYFTAGIPVVSTAMPELLEYHDIVYLSNSHDEFLSNIQNALKEKNENGSREKRIKVSKENTWDNRIGVIIEEFNKTLITK
jgi:hypothetical protein